MHKQDKQMGNKKLFQDLQSQNTMIQDCFWKG